MKRKFNVTGLCVPGKHYMVDLSERLAMIRIMVGEGAYFTINRARQYGKTTILHALAKALSDEYQTVQLDFQSLGSASYENINGVGNYYIEAQTMDLGRTDVIVDYRGHLHGKIK